MRKLVPIPVLMIVLAVGAGCSKNEEQQVKEGKHALDAQFRLTGEPLFNERCRDCHVVNGKGGPAGPDLSHIGSTRSRAHLEQAIREPSKLFPGSAMPPYDTLSKKQIDSLVDYLAGLK